MRYKKQRTKFGAKRPSSKIISRLRKMSERLKMKRRKNLSRTKGRRDETSLTL